MSHFRGSESPILAFYVLISYLSEVMTLEPGDVMITGTLAGVGFTRSPQLFLQPGDVVRVEIENIGYLENPVIPEE